MSKIKKHILAFEQEYDFDMIGICSHHNDYRLAWGLNEKFEIQLSKCEEDYIAVSKKGLKLSNHSLYAYRDGENLIEYYLIKNKHLGKYLIPEKPAIDFFLFLYENHFLKPAEIVEQLREIPSVLGGYIFNPEEIDSTQNIVFG